MAVLRIVTDIETNNSEQTAAFYEDVFGLTRVMDMGFVITSAGQGTPAPQISFASEGGSGTPVPDISIEVDDIDATHARAVAAGAKIEYDLTDEPWGVRRFFLRDPAGKLVNALQHIPK